MRERLKPMQFDDDHPTAAARARLDRDAYSFALVATPTPIQAQAFSLLAINPAKL